MSDAIQAVSNDERLRGSPSPATSRALWQLMSYMVPSRHFAARRAPANDRPAQIATLFAVLPKECRGRLSALIEARPH